MIGTEKSGNLNNGIKRYYRVDEVACYFSVSDRTIYRLIDTGDFKVIRIRGCVRIPVEEINCLEEKLKEESF
jgi:excisionase family DNA binding protein